MKDQSKEKDNIKKPTSKKTDAGKKQSDSKQKPNQKSAKETGTSKGDADLKIHQTILPSFLESV